ncbi:MAG TPA: hypothetical protein VMU50_20560, partial [Polyangia bacterium]|nr:hypothetical protein [Polyangia bacterium]
MRRAVLAAMVILTGCAGPLHQMVEDPRDFAQASGTPSITEVTDLGGGDVPLRGQLRLDGSDGVVTVGETLWVRGKSFGRQPTVRIGGRPAAVLGRTRDGGALVRVPIGTPVGPVPVVVATEGGSGEKEIAIRRYAAVIAPAGGGVAWADVARDGPVAAGATAVDGGRFLALSADGRAAYVSEAVRSVISVVEIPAAGGPRVVGTLDLGPEPVIALLSAAQAAVLVVVRAADLVVVDTSYPLRPVRGTPRALADEAREAGVVAADLSPDGTRLGLATRRSNQLMLLAIASGRAPVLGKAVLAPEVRAPILIDVAFAPDGQSLWALGGDTADSRATGPQPTRLFAVRIVDDEPGKVSLPLARSLVIDEAVDPTALSAGRALPLASGSAIRLPPERATVFVSARRRGDAQQAAAVFRVGAQEIATPAATGSGVMGKVDMSPDGRWLLVSASSGDGHLRLLSAPADARPGEPRSIDLRAGGAGAQVSASGGGPRPAALRVQP